MARAAAWPGPQPPEHDLPMPFIEELRFVLGDLRLNMESDMKKCMLSIECKLDQLLSKHEICADEATRHQSETKGLRFAGCASGGPQEASLPGTNLTEATCLEHNPGSIQTTYAQRRALSVPTISQPLTNVQFGPKLSPSPRHTTGAETLVRSAQSSPNPRRGSKSSELSKLSGRSEQSDAPSIYLPGCYEAHNRNSGITARTGSCRTQTSNVIHGNSNRPASRAMRKTRIATYVDAKAPDGERLSQLLDTADRLTIVNKFSLSAILWATLNDKHSNAAALVYHRLMSGLIVVSVGVSLAQTPDDAPLNGILAVIADTAIDLIFVCDLILRIVSERGKLTFFSKAYNLIDAFAVLSLILRASLGFTPTFEFQRDRDGRALAALLSGFLPVMRLLRVLRFFEEFHLLIQAFRMALAALPALCFMYLLLLLTCTALCFTVETSYTLPTYSNALWYSFISMTTVGYGDFVADTHLGKFFIALFVFMGTLYMAIPIGIIGNAFSEVWHSRNSILLKQKVCLRWYQRGFTPKDATKLFAIFDSDGDGSLSLHELSEMMMEMRMGLTAEEISLLYEAMDKNGDETVTARELMKAVFPSDYHALMASSFSDGDVDGRFSEFSENAGESENGYSSTSPREDLDDMCEVDS